MGEDDLRFARLLRFGTAAADMVELNHPYRIQVLQRLLAEYRDEGGTKRRFAIAAAIRRSNELSDLLSLPIPDSAELKAILASVSGSVGQPAAVDGVSS